MTDELDTRVEFDELVAIALAELGLGCCPGSSRQESAHGSARGGVPAPAGFACRWAPDDDWLPHPVARDSDEGPCDEPPNRLRHASARCGAGETISHHHDGDEECYVLSGSVHTLGRRLGPGDFLHADTGTDHGELWTDEGAQVLLVVAPEDYMPDTPR